MIRISKTPLRISFFGGGTDYPAYFERYPGMVVGTTINLYIYIIALPIPDFCEQRFRFLYSRNESIDRIDEIQHPVIQAVLKEEGYDEPLNVSIMSDVPGGTGLGSSSSFTVGFVNLINALKGSRLSRYALARKAIYIEHDILGENVGIQDQIHAAHGGLSKYCFSEDAFSIHPIRINADCQNALDRSMFLVFTEISRRATACLDEQIKNTKAKNLDGELSHLIALAEQSVAVLEQDCPDRMLTDLGHMLNEAWKTKRKLSSRITNPKIDELHDEAMRLGAYGGKLCGAGAGGFFFLLAPSEKYVDLGQAFGQANVMRISTEMGGSRLNAISDEVQFAPKGLGI